MPLCDHLILRHQYIDVEGASACSSVHRAGRGPAARCLRRRCRLLTVHLADGTRLFISTLPADWRGRREHRRCCDTRAHFLSTWRLQRQLWRSPFHQRDSSFAGHAHLDGHGAQGKSRPRPGGARRRRQRLSREHRARKRNDQRQQSRAGGAWQWRLRPRGRDQSVRLRGRWRTLRRAVVGHSGQAVKGAFSCVLFLPQCGL